MTFDTDILDNELKTLPEFVAGLLRSRTAQRTVKTRLSYARDYNIYFDYLIENALIDSKEKTSINASELARFKTADFDSFLDKYNETHKKTSVARMKASLSVLFKYLADITGDIPQNNFKDVQKISPDSKDVIYLSLDEQDTLVNEIKHPRKLSPQQNKRITETQARDLALIFLFLDTGLRLSEVQKANIGNLCLEDCHISVVRKGGETKDVYFSDEAADYLKSYLNQRMSNPALATVSTKYDALFCNIHGERLTTRGIQKIVEKWVTIALPHRNDISVHKLRSSFAMSFYTAEGDILALQERLNHKSLNTTNIYAKAANNASLRTRNWREKL